MYVACSTLCFSDQTLEDALAAIRAMNFAKADLSLCEAGPHWKPSDLERDGGKLTQKLKASNVPIGAIHAKFEHLDGELTRHQLRNVCRFARHLAVPVISTPAAPCGTPLDQEAARLKDWLRITESEGVMLTLETDAKTLTGDPATAADLCRRAPGLGLTLDPSHYITGEAGPQPYDGVFPHVRHVRLRDSGRQPGQFQVPVGQGEVEYGWIIAQLDRCKYDRALSVDVRPAPRADYAVEPEVRKLKYLLESMV
jgi:sugar phosphate isomerase/epimerase